MLIVGTDPAAVEVELVAWRLTCPNCEGELRPWGHARERDVRGDNAVINRRRPRRSEGPRPQLQMADPFSKSKKLSRSVSTPKVAREPALSSLRGETRATPAALATPV